MKLAMSSKGKLYAQSPTTATVPNMKIPTDFLGSRSMTVLNVNQMLARANQEKINENKLYYAMGNNLEFLVQLWMKCSTHKGLNM